MLASRAVFKTCGVEIALFRPDHPVEFTITHDHPICEEFTEKLRDVILIVENTKLYAHKEVLISRIPYFAALFNSRMTESVSDVVTLAQFNFDTVNSLVDAAYTGKITVTDETILDVMIAAQYLQMDSIMDACVKIVEDQRSSLIRLSNALSIFVFFRALGCGKFDRSLLTFMDMNFMSLSHTSEFNEMPVDYLIEYIGRDSLYIDNEIQVFEAITRWISADDSRKEHAARLLECVRCQLIPEKLITEVVENTNWVRGNSRCMELVNEAKEIICSKERTKLMSFKNYERFSRALIFVVSRQTGIMSFYDPIDNNWIVCKKLPRERKYCEIAAVDENIFAFGCYGASIKTFDVFCTKNNAWHTSVRIFPTVEAIKGKIYVTGGSSGFSTAATVEMLDTAARPLVWVMVASMSKPRLDPASCVADGKFYVIGGCEEKEGILDDGECYDPKTNLWMPIASMNKKRTRCEAAVLKGQIYVVGGHDGKENLGDLERYDPATDTWTTLQGMNTKRSSAGVAVSCGKLFVFGGYDSSTSHTTMEVYDPETDSWQESQMPHHRGSVSVATMSIPASLQAPAF